MKNYFTAALRVRLEDYQNNNNQNPSRIWLNPLALSLSIARNTPLEKMTA